MGLSSLWAKCKSDPDFPKPVKLSARTTVFFQEELDQYLNGCAARTRPSKATVKHQPQA
jgi:prophage regulatory protein